jgi:hypothetical protein
LRGQNGEEPVHSAVSPTNYDAKAVSLPVKFECVRDPFLLVCDVEDVIGTQVFQKKPPYRKALKKLKIWEIKREKRERERRKKKKRKKEREKEGEGERGRERGRERIYIMCMCMCVCLCVFVCVCVCLCV